MQEINQIRQNRFETPLQHTRQPGIAFKIRIKHFVSAGEKLPKSERKCGLETPSYRCVDSDELYVPQPLRTCSRRKNSSVCGYFHNSADNIVHGLIILFTVSRPGGPSLAFLKVSGI